VRFHKGFTLIELMVSISVGMVLLAVAAPSFRQMSVRNRLVTYTNDFISSINLARSESIRRGAPVAVCKSSNGTSCTGTWSDGWIVFANTDGDSPAAVDVGEPILRKHEALAASYTLSANVSFANDITFDADGAAGNAGVFAVCHDGNLVGARAIVVTRLRPRSVADTDGDQIPNKDAGNIAGCTDP
jgi:type IV fimbrial biogenesis protein FimT